MQKIIEGLLVVVDQWVQFMRKGEYHMKIRGIDHLSPTFVHPDLLVDGLAVGTAAVSAGVIMEFHMAAFRTLGNIYTQISGFAAEYGSGSFFLPVRQKAGAFRKGLIRGLPDFLDF